MAHLAQSLMGFQCALDVAHDSAATCFRLFNATFALFTLTSFGEKNGVMNKMNMPTTPSSKKYSPSMDSAFHFGVSETILFEFWRVSNTGGIILSCAILFLFCFVMETIRWCREQFFGEKLKEEHSKKTILRIIDCALHFLQLSISYLLMLTVMTFNFWLSFAVVLGQVLAHYFTSYILPKPIRNTAT